MTRSKISIVARLVTGPLFLLFLWLPLIDMNSSDVSEENGIGEKRKLAEYPHFSWSEVQNWPSQFEDYYDDNFGFRRELLRANSIIRHQLLHAPNERVFFGKNDWMFFNLDAVTNQYRGVNRFSPKEMERFFSRFGNRSKFLEKKGVKFLYVSVPNKGTIYPEHLPNWIKKVGPNHLDQIETFLTENDEPFSYLDLRNTLNEMKNTGALYHKTDTHWNSHGAFYAYQEIVDRLRWWFPELHALSDNEVTLLPQPWSEGKDLAVSLGVPDLLREPFFVRVKLNQPSRVIDVKAWRDGREIDTEEIAIGQPRYESVVTTDRSEAPRVLFIRDSFTTALYPFLKETFHQSRFVGDKQVLFDRRVFDRFKPDVVVVIWVERTLNWVGRRHADFANPNFDDNIAE